MRAGVGAGGAGRRVMRIVERGILVAAALAALLATGVARADNNPNGSVFRAVGWFRGQESTSSTMITCEIPKLDSQIADGVYGAGLWNTYGAHTLCFPDRSNPFASPRRGSIQRPNQLHNQ